MSTSTTLQSLQQWRKITPRDPPKENRHPILPHCSDSWGGGRGGDRLSEAVRGQSCQQVQVSL